MVERLAQLRLGRTGVVEIAFEELAVPVETTEKIELRTLVPDQAVTESAADYEAQRQIL